MRVSTMVVLWLLLGVACQAAPPRVFIGAVPYSGPVEVHEHDVQVDVQKLADATGWKVEHDEGAWHLHKPSESSTRHESGLYVEDRKFDGSVREDGTHLWVSILDLAHFLGGQATFDESVGLVQCTIPGMPVSSAQDPRSALIMQLSMSPYTLIYYYVESDTYCKHFGPIVRQYAQQHPGKLRLVEVDLLHRGTNWIYGLYKTRDNGIPEVVLVDSKGNVVQKLLGDTTLATLEKELTPLMK